MRTLLVLTALIAGLVAAPSASAAPPASVFGGDVPCTVQGDGVDFCSASPRSVTETWDGQTPVDVNFATPDPATFPMPSGGYPLVMMFHGYGGSKLSLSSMHRWLDQGYATYSQSDRGFGQSCGSQASRVALGSVACTNGYNHLQDTRYEVRDAQFLASELVGEGLVDPARIGATGGSYGGGKSMALAALKNRIMLPNGTYAPWTITGGPDNGQTITLAGALPEIPWTDLSYALVPSGGTFDYVTDNVYNGRVGVQKQSFVTGLYASGCAAFAFPDPGSTYCSTTDPDANLQAWKARLDQGEPYDGDPLVQSILNEIQQHHSSYYIDHSVAPAPLLISNGWTDDLFPADESLRFYNRTHAQYPNAPISLMYLDFGHPRGQNKPADVLKLADRENNWFKYYVMDGGGPPTPPHGPTPFRGVETITEACPNSATSEGPYFAPSWNAIHPGEVRMTSDAAQTITPTGGDASFGSTFDPIFGGGACAKVPGADQAGVPSYRMPVAPAGGYTLMGSPTVIADFTMPGASSEVAARLLDVGPDGMATLVSRGLWRPQASTRPVTQVFQLHPNGYRFAEGHVAKLELLPNDAPYGQASNDQQNVTVANLELRLPVLDEPGAAGGAVQAPLPHFYPGDVRPVPTPTKGRTRLAKGRLVAIGKFLSLRVTCPASVDSCAAARIRVRGVPRRGRRGRILVARGNFTAKAGQTRRVSLRLTGAAHRYLRTHRHLRTQVIVASPGTPGLAKGFRGLAVRRAGK